MITLSLSEKRDKCLSALAVRAHLSKKTYALKLLEQSLEDEEDALIASARLDRIDKGMDVPVDLEEIVQKYRDKHGSADLEF